MIIHNLSTLALFAALQLEHTRAGSVAPDSRAVDSFVHRITESLARYECAKRRTEYDCWMAPTYAQDNELLGAMGEVTGNPGRSFAFVEGSPITTYAPGQVDTLYDNALQLIVDVDCASRYPTSDETFSELAAKLVAFVRGASAHHNEDDWRKCYFAAA